MKTIKSVVVEFNRPECNNNCHECGYCKVIDNSFDHEFGTEKREDFECHCDNEDLAIYGECRILTTLIEEEFSNEVIEVLEIEIEGQYNKGAK